ncbi:MAG: alpha/beta hydrolase [Clostridiales bacterium]|nr:alpha/beta hydrolase [Clostridiales bacterium]
MAVYTMEHNPTMAGMLEQKVNIPFACPDGHQLCLQMVKPMWKSGGKGFPMVLFIQGSGWTKPDQFWQLPQMSLLARRGYVIASVTHRSSEEAPGPAFLQDVKTALRFLRAHAEEYDIDKERVCAWGTSSGGNTALLLGMTGDTREFDTEEYGEESSAVQAVVDCFGPTDLGAMYDRIGTGAHGPIIDALVMLVCGQQEGLEERRRKLSPVSYVTAEKKIPPMLMLHGDADQIVWLKDTRAMYDLMVETGHEVDLVEVSNAPHEETFWSLELLEVIFAFIQKHLG